MVDPLCWRRKSGHTCIFPTTRALFPWPACLFCLRIFVLVTFSLHGLGYTVDQPGFTVP